MNVKASAVGLYNLSSQWTNEAWHSLSNKWCWTNQDPADYITMFACFVALALWNDYLIMELSFQDRGLLMLMTDTGTKERSPTKRMFDEVQSQFLLLWENQRKSSLIYLKTRTNLKRNLCGGQIKLLCKAYSSCSFNKRLELESKYIHA